MNRREALKLLSTSSAPFLLPSPLLAAFREVHSAVASGFSFKALNAHQDATVGAMAELIMPTTETPGAKAVRVNEFIDRILADWLFDEEREHFLAGLEDVDARTQNLFEKNFIDASTAQQSEILRALGEDMAAEADAVASGPRGYRGSLPEPENNFYFMLRRLVLVGYFTSEAGFTQQLHQEIIPGRFDGCVPAAPTTPAKSA